MDANKSSWLGPECYGCPSHHNAGQLNAWCSNPDCDRRTGKKEEPPEPSIVFPKDKKKRGRPKNLELCSNGDKELVHSKGLCRKCYQNEQYKKKQATKSNPVEEDKKEESIPEQKDKLCSECNERPAKVKGKCKLCYDRIRSRKRYAANAEANLAKGIAPKKRGRPKKIKPEENPTLSEALDTAKEMVKPKKVPKSIDIDKLPTFTDYEIMQIIQSLPSAIPAYKSIKLIKALFKSHEKSKSY